LSTIALLGSLLGLGFVSGINLYATVLAAGLGIKFNLIELPPELQALAILANTYVLIAAGIMYLVEFFADKIPWLDSFWDSIHTFIRPLGAVVIAFVAIADVNPALELIAVMVTGGVALSSHSTKAGTRAVVNQSPEPVSNIGLSLGEDIVAVIGTWFSFNYPEVMLALVIIFVIIFLFMAPKIFRIIKMQLVGLKGVIGHFQGNKIESEKIIPEKIRERLPEGSDFENIVWLKCFSGKNVQPGRFHFGYLGAKDNKIYFIAPRLIKTKTFELAIEKRQNVAFKKGIIFDTISIVSSNEEFRFYSTKERRPIAESLFV